MEPMHIITGVSLVLGLILLLTSSLFVNVLGNLGDCDLTNSCVLIRWARAAGAFGIIASLLQVSSFALAWFEKWKIWVILHLAVFVLTLTAYSIALDKQANGFYGWGTAASLAAKSKAFMSFAAIDMTYSVVAAGAGYFSK